MSTKSLEETARELASAHKAEDPDTQAVYLVADPSGQEIRLIEVTGSVGSVGELLPYRFEAAPDQGVAYPTVVVLLSPEEWDKVRRGELALPEGWESEFTPVDAAA
ncbi:MAG: hypothetical protein ACQEXJ_06140 [Myxococcota bacterium]